MATLKLVFVSRSTATIPSWIMFPSAEELLGESPRWTGGKQRLTAARLHELQVAEGYVVSTPVVRELVAEWKRWRQEVFVPLTYRAGRAGGGRLLRGAPRRRAAERLDRDAADAG